MCGYKCLKVAGINLNSSCTRTDSVLPPPPPENLSITFSTDSSFNVSWSPPSGPMEGGVDGYVFDVTGEGCGCVSMNISGDNTSVKCSGWTPTDQTCLFEIRTISKDCGFSSDSFVSSTVTLSSG